MSVIKYRDPVYVTADKTALDCVLLDGEMPFTASSHDPEAHGRELFAQIVANAAAIPIKPYVAPALPRQPSQPPTKLA